MRQVIVWLGQSVSNGVAGWLLYILWHLSYYYTFSQKMFKNDYAAKPQRELKILAEMHSLCTGHGKVGNCCGMLRIVAERSGMHHAAILPFPGNGGMPLFPIIYDFFHQKWSFRCSQGFFSPITQKKWEKVITTPHSAFSRIWHNAIFFYNFWLVSSEMIV